MRQEFGQAADGMGDDSRKDILKPGERIDSDPLAGCHEAPEDRCRAAIVIAAKEHPVVSADRDAADSALGGVIIDLQGVDREC